MCQLSVSTASPIRNLQQSAISLDVSEQKDEQLKSIQEQCFQEVEELKTVLMNERSLKVALAEELDVREKRLQQTAVEIQALSSLKTGLEGSLQTSNTRANDEKVKYDREMSLKEDEMDKMREQIQRLEKDLEIKLQQIRALEQDRDRVKDAYEQMMAGVKSELGEFVSAGIVLNGCFIFPFPIIILLEVERTQSTRNVVCSNMKISIIVHGSALRFHTKDICCCSPCCSLISHSLVSLVFCEYKCRKLTITAIFFYSQPGRLFVLIEKFNIRFELFMLRFFRAFLRENTF